MGITLSYTAEVVFKEVRVPAGKAAVDVCDEAIQLLGGYGYMLDYEVERFARDAKICELYEGTREIQKNTIASAIMGKLK